MKKLSKLFCGLLILVLVFSSFRVVGMADETSTHTEHTWRYTWDGIELKAVCWKCGEKKSLSLNRDMLYGYTGEIFSYCYGWSIYDSALVISDSWDMEYSFKYAPMDDKSGYWTFGLPTNPGTYKITLRMPEVAEVYNNTEDFDDQSNFICVKIEGSHAVSDEWTVDGVKLCNTCQRCGTRVAEISVDTSTSYGYLCSDTMHAPELTYWYSNNSVEKSLETKLPTIGLLYEGNSDDYSLQTQIPDTQGMYNVYIAIYDGEFEIDNVTQKTDPVDYEVKIHDWQYTAEDYSLYADCSVCDAHAEVCINTSTVYEASRDFQNKEIKDYDVFYETDWSDQDGIANYSVLFSGRETDTDTLYDRAFVKPTTVGDYNVRLALLSDDGDPDSAYLTTKEKVFYLADIPLSECDVITYGNTEIAQFTEPEMKNGYYQVGTKEELLWCVYKASSDSNIEITNDIVVNPITVLENGNIYSAREQIYKWKGLGSASSPYTGKIVGNGHTIYGLYMPDASNKYTGFINYGSNCEVSGLSIENSVLYGVNAGAIMAYYNVNKSDNDLEVINCYSLNCYISGSDTEGGIIARISNSNGVELYIDICGSDSSLYGDAKNGAGGIVGRVEKIAFVEVFCCYNFGSITSKKGIAGGIIGYGNLQSAESTLTLLQCFNIGSIQGGTYEGGVAGYLKDYGLNKIYIDNCSNTGYLGTCTNIGGIAGYVNATTICRHGGNYYANAKVAFKTKSDNVSLEDYATKISKSEIKNGFICGQYGHTECSHWDMITIATCTNDGEMQLKCAVCGTIIEDKVTHAGGHHFASWGECSVCGISKAAYEARQEAGLVGSLFTSSPVLIVVVLCGALVIMMAAWLLIRRKRKQKKSVNQ